ncbi:hypothetical protein [Escherichia coli]|uniref:hypothetical protein n=1 Tax=Escherichia coli TaxID=562 RepID=UPI0038906408
MRVILLISPLAWDCSPCKSRVVKPLADETFRLCRVFDDIITVDSDAIPCGDEGFIRRCARGGGTFRRAGAGVGMKKYIAQHNIRGERLAHILSGANVNFHGLRYVSERCELGEQRGSVTGGDHSGRKGQFQIRQLLGGCSVTEFNYRLLMPKRACIFVGVRRAVSEERKEIFGKDAQTICGCQSG